MSGSSILLHNVMHIFLKKDCLLIEVMFPGAGPAENNGNRAPQTRAVEPGNPRVFRANLALHLTCIGYQKNDQAVGSGLSLSPGARRKLASKGFQLSAEVPTA